MANGLSPHDSSALPLLGGLSDVAGSYDLILCDVWGVVHNGLAAFPAACTALENARAMGSTVVLISNAPRPSSYLVAMLDRLGVPRGSYDDTITSGDVTRGVLAAQPGARIFHLGPPRDLGTFEGLDVIFTGIAEAQMVVCTGLLNDDVETPDDYMERLAEMRAHDLAFICANPDIVVERGDKLIYCAGALAKAYEAMDGQTTYCGKPHAPIYAEAMRRVEAVRGGLPAADRILAIGDALHTDIIGASEAGFDSLFISGGIHAAELRSENGAVPDMAAVARLFAYGPRPRAMLPRLTW